MKVCSGHNIHVPLLFTFKFPGAEYWCPVCERNFDVFGSGSDVEGTLELDRRHEVLSQYAAEYLGSMDIEYSGLTEDELLKLEQSFDPGGDRPTVTCDGCGTEAPARLDQHGYIDKPSYWYERQDEDGRQLACSRACITTIANRTGKTSMVMPW